MSSVHAASQSAERQLAEAELRSLVAKFTPEQQRLVATVRRSIRKRLPTAHEIVYEYSGAFVISYSPNERGYEGVLVINGSANGVRLYFGNVKAWWSAKLRSNRSSSGSRMNAAGSGRPMTSRNCRRAG